MDSYTARFGGIRRLFSQAGLDRLRAAHVCVVGIGGVGSWAAEALARSGVGQLTLIDLDDVCISNVNRQVHAITGQLGQPKVEVTARRVQAINPDCQVHPVHSFFLKSNAQDLLQPHFDCVIDAIDSPSRKALLIARCRERGIPVITTGAAAGRSDPTATEVVDLAFSSHDRLLAQVRRNLRRDYGFPRGDQAFGIEAIISRQPVVYANKDGSVCLTRDADSDLRLDCEIGLGTACFVTGTFGFVAASRAIRHIAESKTDARPATSSEAKAEA